MSLKNLITKRYCSNIKLDPIDQAIVNLCKFKPNSLKIICKKEWEGGSVEIICPNESLIEAGQKILIKFNPLPQHVFATITIKSMFDHDSRTVRFAPFDDKSRVITFDVHRGENETFGTFIMPNESVIISDVTFVPINSVIGRNILQVVEG